MHSLLRVILLVGVLSSLQFVAAAPSRIQKRSFKVERVRNPSFQGHDGPRQLLKSLRKFRMGLPPGLLEFLNSEELEDLIQEVVTAALEGKGKGRKGGAGGSGARNGTANGNTGGRNSTGTGIGKVTATPERGDVEYLSPVRIGGQSMLVNFDSGSSDLWVFSTALPAAAQQGHTPFDPDKSNTFRLLNDSTFFISYGDGSKAGGIVGTDTVEVGGATVTRQAVELATGVSRSFVEDTQNNGLLGLAFSELNTVKPRKQKTFFDNVMPDLAEPVWTADLRKNAVGAYEFGRIDTSKFVGDLAWVPVNSSQGFWEFPSTSFAVGDAAPRQTDLRATAIVDTGTTLILASSAIVNGYFSLVEGAVNNQTVGGVTVPCAAQLPDLKLDVGGTLATVKGSDINFAPIDGVSE